MPLQKYILYFIEYFFFFLNRYFFITKKRNNLIYKTVIALKPFLEQYFIEIIRKKIENYTKLCYHTIKQSDYII